MKALTGKQIVRPPPIRVDTLNDPDGHGRAGKATGAGTETDLDGGEGSGYVAQIALDRQNIETEAGEA